MTHYEQNKKPEGRVQLPPAPLTQREREECVRIIEKFKALGLITVKPPLTEGQVKNLEGRSELKIALPEPTIRITPKKSARELAIEKRRLELRMERKKLNGSNHQCESSSSPSSLLPVSPKALTVDGTTDSFSPETRGGSLP